MSTELQAHDGPDTALARLLHASGRLPLAELQGALASVRGARPGGPGLAAELVARGLISREELEARFLPALNAGEATWREGGEETWAEERQPERLGPYRVRRELGKGGMGVVLEAYDPALDRTVAIKRLLGAVGPEELLRFAREARLTAALDHPGIARVIEVVREGPGAPYLVMDHVPGTSLHAVCRGERPSAGRTAELLLGIAEAVAHAHAAGIVHRDLKPHNVMVRPDGRPVVLDFGLARRVQDESLALTLSGDLLGTPAYMAPEQACGGDVGPAADVYGLGAILYELLCGRPPFSGASVLEVLGQVERSDPVSPRQVQPTVPLDLETMCLRCLAKAPRERYPSAEALAADLRAFLAGEPIAARPLGPGARAWRRARRHPLRLAAAALGLLVLVAGAVAIGRERARAQSEAARAAAARAAEVAAERARVEFGRAGMTALARLSDVLRYRYRPRQSPDVEARWAAEAQAQAEAVLEDLRRLVAEAPEAAELRLLEGRAQLELYRYDEARACAEAVRVRDASCGPAWRLEGEALLGSFLLASWTGGMRQVAPELERALAAFQRATSLGEPAASLFPVWEHLAAQDLEAAERRLDGLLVREAPREEHHLARAMIQLSALTPRSGPPSPAARRALLASLDAALALCPRLLPALRLRAGTRGRFGDLAGAREDYGYLIQVAPELAHFGFNGRAVARDAAGDSAGALADLDEAIRRAPDYAPAYRNRGWLRLRLGDRRGGESDLSEAIRLRPEDDDAYTARAALHAAEGRLQDALADYEQAIRLAPDLAVEAYRGRAGVLGRLGHEREAALDLEQSLRLDPHQAEAPEFRRLIARTLGRPARY